MTETMKFDWCIGVFKGDQAGSILGLANEGVGYFIRKSTGSGKALEVEAAFRRARDSAVPDHLTVADGYQSDKLDLLYAKRHGIRLDKAQEPPKAVSEVFFNNRKDLR